MYDGPGSRDGYPSCTLMDEASSVTHSKLRNVQYCTAHFRLRRHDNVVSACHFGSTKADGYDRNLVAASNIARLHLLHPSQPNRQVGARLDVCQSVGACGRDLRRGLPQSDHSLFETHHYTMTMKKFLYRLHQWTSFWSQCCRPSVLGRRITPLQHVLIRHLG